MNITEICLIAIAAILLVKGIISIVITINAWKYLKKNMDPLIRKSDGILNNVSAISETAREEMEEIRTVVNDVKYKTREVTNEVQGKIIPTITELAGAISGVTRLISYFFTRKK